MRLLIATDHYPPFIGGAHRWAELLAAGLARRGNEVTVATVWHGGLPRVESVGDVVIHRVPQLRTALPRLVGPGQRHQAPFPDPLSIRAIRRVIRETAPEVVLAHGWIASSAAAAIGKSDIPLLLSAHDYGYFCATRSLLYRGKPCSGPELRKCLSCAGNYYGAPKGWIAVGGVKAARRTLVRKLAGVQSVSSFVDEMTARHLLGEEEPGTAQQSVPRFIIPAFVDIDPPRVQATMREVEEFLAKLPDVPFILFVGALRPIKGIEVLFEAYGRLEAPPPLVLLGTFERDTPKQFPSGTLVFPDVPHEAVIAAWGRALFGVAPSVWPEPLGTVTVEGISCGAPVIATVPSGMIDVLGGGCGVLVPQGDVDALADAMRSLIEDPTRRESIARAARAHSVNFAAEAVVPRYEEALRQLVERGRAEHRSGSAPS